jgi:hypothetical protein
MGKCKVFHDSRRHRRPHFPDHTQRRRKKATIWPEQILDLQITTGAKHQQPESMTLALSLSIHMVLTIHSHLDCAAMLFALGASQGLFTRSVEHNQNKVPPSLAQAIPSRIRSRY